MGLLIRAVYHFGGHHQEVIPCDLATTNMANPTIYSTVAPPRTLLLGLHSVQNSLPGHGRHMVAMAGRIPTLLQAPRTSFASRCPGPGREFGWLSKPS